MTFDKEEKKLPVEDRPLHHAGQSLEEERSRLFDDRIMPHLVVITGIGGVAVYEWITYAFNSPRRPWVLTVLWLLVLLYSGRKMLRYIREGRALSTGIKGEKAVGERLTELMAAGYKVLHDIPGRAGNIDHVVIGPAGVFAIETKTLRKRRSPNAKVRYDGQCITVDGMTPQRDPLVQALAEAGELRAILQKSTGKTFFVQPVIVYPGWYVEQLVPNPKVWVFNDKQLVSHLKTLPRKLEDTDVNMIAYHLEQYVRSRKE